MKRTLRVLSMALCVCLLLTSVALAETPHGDEHQKYDEPVTIHVIGSVSDQQRKNTLRDEYTKEDNPWTDAYLDVLGVKREYLWVATNGDEATMKRNLALSSGDIPDVLHDVNGVELQELAEAGLIVENIRDLYEAEATDRLKGFMDAKGEAAWQSGMVDGVSYGIPMNGGLSNDERGFVWIRRDWLDNLGLAIPTNYEEFMSVVEAFVTKDPDQNGADDTFGIAFCNNMSAECMTMRYFFNMFHTDYGYWVERDGKLVNTDVLPETKQALSVLHDMYAKGWLDPEFGVKDMDTVAMDITNNKVGIVFATFWTPLSNVLNDCIQANEQADFVCVPTNILGVDGEYALTGQKAKSNRFVVISKQCENPEAVIRMLNLFVDLNATQYETYGITPDGREMWSCADWPAITMPTKNMTNMINAGKYLRGELTADELNAEELSTATNVQAFHDGDRTMWSWARVFAADGPNLSCMWHVAEAWENFDKFTFYDAYLGMDTPGMIDYQSMINSIRDEKFIKIIIGDATVDSFDDYVTEWYNAGGQIITDEVNEWYAAQ